MTWLLFCTKSVRIWAFSGLIGKLQAQVYEDRRALGQDFKGHVRRCAGYLSLLRIAQAASGYVGSQLASLFSLFVMLVGRTTRADKARYILTERKLGYVEQAGMKLILKAGEALKLLEGSVEEPPLEQLLGHEALWRLSSFSPATLPVAAGNAPLQEKRKGSFHVHACVFCNVMNSYFLWRLYFGY